MAATGQEAVWLRGAWPLERALRAVQALGQSAGLCKRGEDLPDLAGDPEQVDLDFVLGETAARLGVELTETEIFEADLGAGLLDLAPCLVRIAAEGDERLFAIVRRQANRAVLLGPEGRLLRVPIARFRELRPVYDGSVRQGIDRLVGTVGLTGGARGRAAEHLADKLGARQRVGRCWCLRMPPSAGPWLQGKSSGLLAILGRLAAVEVVLALVVLAGWWLVGRGAITGRFAGGAFLLWALLALATVPLGAISLWWRSCFATGFGALLRRRLLHGIQRMNVDQMRRSGAGRALAQVLEAQAFERTAFDVAMRSLTAVIQIVLAFAVLSLGAAASVHLPLFAAWLVFLALLAWAYHGSRVRWTEDRMAVSSELTEQMIGHRTRVAQLPPDAWHEAEEELLGTYVRGSAEMDKMAVRFQALVAGGWLPIGLLGLLPAFALGASSPATLAVSIGGVLLAHQALQAVAGSMEQAIQTSISWRQVAPLYHAAVDAWPMAAPEAIVEAGRRAPIADGATLIEAQEISFQHERRFDPTLADCDLVLAQGDRVLLEGPSGSGKSTLGAVLAGLRRPRSGIVLLRGVDLETLGLNAWRRCVVLAPQFQENHIFTASLAFNLLLGRGWPPDPESLAAARRICGELGLSELLEDMPLGLEQVVGEHGWQLSHGERSRVFLARALLEEPEVLILDESLGALDPEIASRVLDCVLRRAQTLILVSHP